MIFKRIDQVMNNFIIVQYQLQNYDVPFSVYGTVFGVLVSGTSPVVTDPQPLSQIIGWARDQVFSLKNYGKAIDQILLERSLGVWPEADFPDQATNTNPPAS